ncbi:MAG: hypothetical protein AAF518_16625 [Spirochaetota bacterium]
MKSFLKENPTIVFGLGLPLLLALIFSIASLVPTLLVDPPQYDVVYATGYYDDRHDFQVTVSDNKARVTYVTGVGNHRIPRLWYYSAKTGAAKEIALVLPADVIAPRHRKKRSSKMRIESSVS